MAHRNAKEELAAFCAKHGITRAALARDLGLVRQTIWHWEQEDHLPHAAWKHFEQYERDKHLHRLKPLVAALPVGYREIVAEALCSAVETFQCMADGKHTKGDLEAVLEPLRRHIDDIASKYVPEPPKPRGPKRIDPYTIPYVEPNPHTELLKDKIPPDFLESRVKHT